MDRDRRPRESTGEPLREAMDAAMDEERRNRERAPPPEAPAAGAVPAVIYYDHSRSARESARGRWTAAEGGRFIPNQSSKPLRHEELDPKWRLALCAEDRPKAETLEGWRDRLTEQNLTKHGRLW